YRKKGQSAEAAKMLAKVSELHSDEHKQDLKKQLIRLVRQDTTSQAQATPRSCRRRQHLVIAAQKYATGRGQRSFYLRLQFQSMARAGNQRCPLRGLDQSLEMPRRECATSGPNNVSCATSQSATRIPTLT